MPAHADLKTPDRVLAAHQPHFLPWLRWFHKALTAQVFVLLDDVQYVKGGWQNRNKLKGPAGALLLTLPVHQRLGQRIDQVAIDPRRDWRRRQLETLRACYGRAPHFQRVFARLEAVYAACEWRELLPFNLALLEALFELLGGAPPELARSSELAVSGRASERLVNLCRARSASAYLTGAHAAEHYLDAGAFQQAGIELRNQAWQAPVYPQLFPEAGFVSDLSIVDLLMMTGPDARAVLLAGPHGATAEASPARLLAAEP